MSAGDGWFCWDSVAATAIPPPKRRDMVASAEENKYGARSRRDIGSDCINPGRFPRRHPARSTRQQPTRRSLTQPNYSGNGVRPRWGIHPGAICTQVERIAPRRTPPPAGWKQFSLAVVFGAVGRRPAYQDRHGHMLLHFGRRWRHFDERSRPRFVKQSVINQARCCVKCRHPRPETAAARPG